ncbi:DsbA family protein [Arcanobacterium canis]
MSEPNQNTFPPARELEDDALAHSSAPTPPPSRDQPSTKSHRSLVIALVCVVTVVVVALVLTMLLWKTGSSTPAPQATSASASAPVTEETGAGQFKPVEQSDKAKKLIASQQRRQAGDPMAVGKVDAPVVMSVYSDYRCPHCMSFAHEKIPALQKYVDNGTLRIEFSELPILGDQSTLAAKAAIAAGKQGKYLPFHDAIFGSWKDGNRPDYTPQFLKGIAKEAGVPDLEKFAKDMESDTVASQVKATYDLGINKLGFEFVPSILVGEQFVDGSYPVDVFAQVVESEAKAKGSQ